MSAEHEPQRRAGGDLHPAPGHADLQAAYARIEELWLDLDRRRHEQEALHDELQQLDRRLRRVEESLLFRTLRFFGRKTQSLARRAGQSLLHSPLHRPYRSARGDSGAGERYRRWLEAHRYAFEPLAAPARRLPRFSVLLAVHRPRPDWLNHAVESVLAQSYGHWQLCLGVDGVLDLEAEAMLNRLIHADTRLLRVDAPHPGISGALNAALEKADGDYVLCLDQDDFLEKAALEQIARDLLREPADLLYTDEDYTDESGVPEQPNFKPGFSPELLLSCMYMGHLLVLNRTLLRELGGFRFRYDGAQDHDAALRFFARGARCRRLPLVLYHWRRHAGSTAASAAAKPYAHAAGRRALQDLAAAQGWDVQVEDGHRAHCHQLRWTPPPGAAQSVIVASRSSRLLGEFLQTIHAFGLPPTAEIVVVHHLDTPFENRKIERLARDWNCRYVTYPGQFNFSEMNNLGAGAASADQLVFLNDDTRPLRPGWLERMSGQLGRSAIGIVGGLLRYRDGSIQHAGVAMGLENAAGHPGRYLFDSPLFPWINESRDVSAVTGACLGLRREVFKDAGGFDPGFANNFGDIDLCLRVRTRGLRVIVDRSIEMTHFEKSTRRGGHTTGERIRFLSRWNEMLRRPDEFYSPHLRLDAEHPDLPL